MMCFIKNKQTHVLNVYFISQNVILYALRRAYYYLRLIPQPGSLSRADCPREKRKPAFRQTYMLYKQA